MVELWDILDENGNSTGRLHERGKPMRRGEYHLVVHVWVMNSKGEFLISRRSEDRGHKWHTTGGAAVIGDDSFSTALKETREEIGVKLDPQKGVFFKRFKWPRVQDEGGFLTDVWLFRQDVDINETVLQVEEVCDIMWADREKIMQMVDEGIFVTLSHWYPYLDEFLSFCED